VHQTAALSAGSRAIGLAGRSGPRRAADLTVLGNQNWQSDEHHRDGQTFTGWIRTPAQRDLGARARRPGRSGWPSGAGGAGSRTAGGALGFGWSEPRFEENPQNRLARSYFALALPHCVELKHHAPARATVPAQAAPVSASSSSSNVGGTGRFPSWTSNTLPISSSWLRTEACIDVSRSTSISEKM
jgi:hypothetical protein